MQGNQSMGGGLHSRTQTGAHLLVFVARTFACPLELVLRRQFGSRYLGMPALAAMFFLPMWVTLFPKGVELNNPSGRPTGGSLGISLLWWLLLIMLIRARVEIARMSRKGEHVHTRYNGTPRLSCIFRRTSEIKIKGLIEPALGCLTGFLLMPLDEPLGGFLVASGVALLFMQTTIESADHARALQLNDAFIEQESLAERFRAMQQDRW